MQFTNLRPEGLRGAAFAISQCTRFSGAPGDGNCTNSQFQIRDIAAHHVEGTSESDDSSPVASFQCSTVAPCTNIGLFDVDLKYDNGTEVIDYLCDNVVDASGFTCTGKPCIGGSATGEC